MKLKIFILSLASCITLSSYAQSKFSQEPSSQPGHIIRFYPNPATAVINFDFMRNYDASYSLLVFNFMGKKVYELKNTPSRINIDLENFYRGIYIYQLRSKNGLIVESGKFQVVK